MVNYHELRNAWAPPFEKLRFGPGPPVTADRLNSLKVQAQREDDIARGKRPGKSQCKQSEVVECSY